MPESRRTFGEQLGDVRGEVVKLAARACEQIGAATQALLDADLSLVDRVDESHYEIEQRAGLMRNVARQTSRLYPRELQPRIRGIIEQMGAQASVQTHLAVDAFADGDEAIAAALPDMDDVMDDLQKEL